MPQLDITTFSSQIIWLIVTFSVLFVIMWRVAIPKITNVLEGRQQRIEGNLEKAESLKKDAENTLKSYEEAIAKAHAEAQVLIAETSQKLQSEATEKDTEMSETIQAKVAESEAKILKAQNLAMEGINDIAHQIAMSATEKLSGAKPNSSAARAAVDTAMKAR